MEEIYPYPDARAGSAKQPYAKGRSFDLSKIRSSFLVAAAALLHLSVTVMVYLTGRLALFVNSFDVNGIGIFATDGYVYRAEAAALVKILTHDGIAAWLATAASFHVKLYSLSFAVLSPLFGANILSAEPLNLLYYVSILILVFKLGQEVFDRRVALLATFLVALWPSFLLHTTQLLRDQLFIGAILLLILIYAKWLKKAYPWRRGLVMGVAGGIGIALLRSTKSNTWELVIAILFLGAGFVIVRQLREKRARGGNLIGLALMLLLTISVPQIFPEPATHMDPPIIRALAEKDPSLIDAVLPDKADLPPEPPMPGWEVPWARIAFKRARFVSTYPKAGSNIDADVQFTSLGDSIRYVPRAVVIGLFAPFPRMWFEPGDLVGVRGRLLSGAETLIMYGIELLALIGLWQWRRSLSVWLLASVAMLGMTALGLVALNVATLYRMRYSFWILLIILGAAGAAQILPSLFRRKIGEGRFRAA